MVNSQLTGCSGPMAHKLLQENLLLPLEPPNVISSELEEFDSFDDVFGPVTALPPLKVNPVNLGSDAPLSELNKFGHDNDPVVIHTARSHSLVGPTPSVSRSLRPSKLTIYESTIVPEKSEELVDGVSEDCLKKFSDDDEPLLTESRGVGLEDFEVLKLVGEGAFGKVFQVKKKGTSEIYAMKVMRKDKIMEKNHAEHMKAERDILTKIDHPFIVQLRYSFQTKYRLYLVLDFVNGGDLFFQLSKQGLFREDLARFYAAEVVSAVSHLHANGIMHRDIKPENILLDADGHVMLTDFGLAKQFDKNTRSNSMCGTVEYMAPEIVLSKGHDKAADWWSVGVLLFEMLTGKLPFNGSNRVKIQQKIVLKGKIKMPAYLSSEAHSLLKSLLQKEATKRLGSGPGGSEEIKKHKWFMSINWKKLDARQIQPSFRPAVSGKLCIANFEEKWTKMPLSDSPVASPVGHDRAFRGFSFVRPPAPLLQEI